LLMEAVWAQALVAGSLVAAVERLGVVAMMTMRTECRGNKGLSPPVVNRATARRA
jgi:hypothetical protein